HFRKLLGGGEELFGVLQLGDGAMETQEGAFGKIDRAALLVQPVGVDEARHVVVGLGTDRVEEGGFVRHGWALPSLSGDISELMTRLGEGATDWSMSRTTSFAYRPSALAMSATSSIIRWVKSRADSRVGT